MSTWKTRRGRQEESQDGPEVDGTETFPTDVSLSDRDGVVARRIPNSAGFRQRDVYLTCERGVPRKSEELWRQ